MQSISDIFLLQCTSMLKVINPQTAEYNLPFAAKRLPCPLSIQPARAEETRVR